MMIASYYRKWVDEDDDDEDGVEIVMAAVVVVVEVEVTVMVPEYHVEDGMMNGLHSYIRDEQVPLKVLASGVD